MIGKITTGKSFRGCLLYCLNDKQQKQGEKMVMKNRAEVLLFNQCGGSGKELIKQFEEVRRLNAKLAKPVLHITLSFAAGEQLSKSKLMDICEHCAKDMGFENNQYVAVEHKDAGHQHIHIVANRVGFDKRTVSDSNSYKRIAEYCRKMELKYQLKEVLSPKKYLSKELRQLPRFDARKEALRQNIGEAVLRAKNYDDFAGIMKQKGYTILKGRGIAFIDSKAVKVKGSEVGYSLQTIEKILVLKPEFRIFIVKQKEQKRMDQLNEQRPTGLPQNSGEMITGKVKQFSKETNLKKQNTIVSKLSDVLLKPELQTEGINSALLKKKKRRRKHLHL